MPRNTSHLNNSTLETTSRETGERVRGEEADHGAIYLSSYRSGWDGMGLKKASLLFRCRPGGMGGWLVGSPESCNPASAW